MRNFFLLLWMCCVASADPYFSVEARPDPNYFVEQSKTLTVLAKTDAVVQVWFGGAFPMMEQCTPEYNGYNSSCLGYGVAAGSFDHVNFDMGGWYDYYWNPWQIFWDPCRDGNCGAEITLKAGERYQLGAYVYGWETGRDLLPLNSYARTEIEVLSGTVIALPEPRQFLPMALALLGLLYWRSRSNLLKSA